MWRNIAVKVRGQTLYTLKMEIETVDSLSVELFFNAITFFLQMFIIKTVSGEHVDLDAFDISGSKYTPEGEV